MNNKQLKALVEYIDCRIKELVLESTQQEGIKWGYLTIATSDALAHLQISYGLKVNE